MANEFKVLVYMTTIIGSGYALMKYTVPDEEAIKKVRQERNTNLTIF